MSVEHNEQITHIWLWLLLILWHQIYSKHMKITSLLIFI